MNSDRLSGWLSLGANLGVVAGLALVLLQMNQNESLLRIQILNQYFDSYIAADTAFAGENLPAIWEKSAVAPEDLSLADMRALEAQTFSPVTRWISLYRLSESGIAEESLWKDQVALDAGYYFGTPYGRAWWQHYSAVLDDSFLPPALKDVIDETLAGSSSHLVENGYRSIQEIAIEIRNAEKSGQ